MQNSSQKRIFVHFIIIVLHYFNALAKYSLKYWRCQLAIWSFVSQINIGWTKCIVARPVKFVMGHRQPMQAPALSSDIMNMQCIGFCWCVELTVFELFAVVWNVLKIILGIICYQYVCSFDARWLVKDIIHIKIVYKTNFIDILFCWSCFCFCFDIAATLSVCLCVFLHVCGMGSVAKYSILIQYILYIFTFLVECCNCIASSAIGIRCSLLSVCLSVCLITNMNSYMGFRLQQKLMTLNVNSLLCHQSNACFD